MVREITHHFISKESYSFC